MTAAAEVLAAMAERMNRLTEVKWDRCVIHDGTAVAYGWIYREDDHADFVILDFSWGQRAHAWRGRRSQALRAGRGRLRRARRLQDQGRAVRLRFTRRRDRFLALMWPAKRRQLAMAQRLVDASESSLVRELDRVLARYEAARLRRMAQRDV